MYPCKTPCGDIDCLNSCIHSKKENKTMKTYRVVLSRVEYYAKEYIIESSNEETAIDKAWDMSGNWQKVDAEEFTNECKEELKL
jgi:hypothetical protein